MQKPTFGLAKSAPVFDPIQAVKHLAKITSSDLRTHLELVTSNTTPFERVFRADQMDETSNLTSPAAALNTAWNRLEQCSKNWKVVFFQSSVCAVALARAYNEYVDRAVENSRVKRPGGLAYTEVEDTRAFKGAVGKCIKRDLGKDANRWFWQEMKAAQRLSDLVMAIGGAIVVEISKMKGWSGCRNMVFGRFHVICGNDSWISSDRKRAFRLRSKALFFQMSCGR